MQRGERAKHRMPDVQLSTRSTLDRRERPTVYEPSGSEPTKPNERQEVGNRCEGSLAVMVDEPLFESIVLCLNFSPSHLTIVRWLERADRGNIAGDEENV